MRRTSTEHEQHPLVVVISDLHIGAGDLDRFDRVLEDHLVDFLAGLSSHPGGLELVINGDFLDFLLLASTSYEGGWTTSDGIPLFFSETLSVEILETIVAAHPRVFSALGSFIESGPARRLVLLPGNHDVDLFWPEVRNRLVGAIAGAPWQAGGKVEVVLSRGYRPRSRSDVWIEHGHQFDPWNGFAENGREQWSEESPPILVDSAGVLRLRECFGTHFVLHYVTRLMRTGYPFAMNVGLWRLVRMIATSAGRSRPGRLQALIALAYLCSWLRRALKEHGDERVLAVSDRTSSGSAWELLAALDWADSVNIDQALVRSGLGERLSRVRERPDEDAAERIAGALVARPYLLQSADERPDGFMAAGADRGFLRAGARTPTAVSISEVLSAGAAWIRATTGAAIVVMGHSHEAVYGRDEPYFNPGCWMRQLDSRTRLTDLWSRLDDPVSAYPYRLLYVEIDARPKGEANLRLYAESKQRL